MKLQDRIEKAGNESFTAKDVLKAKASSLKDDFYYAVELNGDVYLIAVSTIDKVKDDADATLKVGKNNWLYAPTGSGEFTADYSIN